MTKKIVTLFISIALCLSTLFVSGCSSYFFNPKYPMLSPSFSNRKYSLPDKSELNKKIEKINELVQTSGNKDEIFSLRMDLLYALYEASTSQTLAQIYYDLDASNTQNKTRYEEINDFMNTFTNDVREVEKTILKSSYKQDLVDLVGEAYAEQMLASQTKSDELLDLESKETKLIADYSLYYNNKNIEKLGETYLNLVKTRNAIAKEYTNADGVPYDNYLEYSYENFYGRDYTPDDVKETRNAVLENILPLYKNANEKMNAIISDMKKSDKGLTGLSEAKLKEFMSYIIDNTASGMKPSWQYMLDKNLYDFTVNENKANTSYVNDFIAYGDAFMFINADGALEYDLPTVIHEFGHYNAVFNTDDDKAGDNTANYDLAETHSQCFELLAIPATKKLFKRIGYQNSSFYFTNKTLEFLWALLSNCAFDEFEYEIYNTPEENLSTEYFQSTFAKVKQKYISDTTYDYYDIPHLFQSPGYCISYVVSLLFSTEIASGEAPVDTYLKVVSYGYNHYLSDVYKPLGLSNPLETESVRNAAAYYTKLLASTN